MDNIIKNLENIFNSINEITKENKLLGDVLFNNFTVIIDTLQNNAVDKLQTIDVSEQIIVLSNLLGFDLEKLVEHIILNNKSQFDHDEDTLKFITTNTENINNSIDDYETFLANAKIKENLGFLKGEL